MLTRLEPTQIAAHWPTLKFGIENSLPPVAMEAGDKINKIYLSLLMGESDCWIQHKIVEGATKILGMAVTRIMTDDNSGTKNLLIYCLYNYRPMEDEDWGENFYIIKKYGKAKGCHRLIAYSNEKRLIYITRKLGGSTEYTFLSLPIGG
jgi:hypothetical protein